MLAWSASGDDGGAGKGAIWRESPRARAVKDNRARGRGLRTLTLPPPSLPNSAIAKVTGAKAAPSVVTLTFVVAW